MKVCFDWITNMIQMRYKNQLYAVLNEKQNSGLQKTPCIRKY